MKWLLFTLLFLAAGIVIVNTGAWLLGKGNRTLNEEFLSPDVTSVLKGVAMLAVMTGHIGNLFGVRYLTPLGAFGVAIFLFCSGYGLQKNIEKNGTARFWRKRIKNVYVPYLIVEVFSYFFYFEDVTAAGVIQDLLLITPLHPLGWYMRCLFLYYIAFYIGTWAEQRWNVNKLLIVAGASVMMFLCMLGLYKEQVLSFFLGVLAAQKHDKAEKTLQNQWLGIAMLVLGVGALATKQLDVIRQSPWPVLYGVRVLQVTGGLLAAVILGSVAVKKLPEWFFLAAKLTGILSYELYLIHMYFMPDGVSYGGIAVFFLASIAVSCAAYYLKQKVVNRLADRALFL